MQDFSYPPYGRESILGIHAGLGEGRRSRAQQFELQETFYKDYEGKARLASCYSGFCIVEVSGLWRLGLTQN